MNNKDRALELQNLANRLGQIHREYNALKSYQSSIEQELWYDVVDVSVRMKALSKFYYNEPDKQ